MLQYGFFTDKGSRKINEDRVGIAIHDNSYCFVIADGLGGHGYGEEASRIAVDSVCKMFKEGGYSADFLDNAITLANERILRMQNEKQLASKMMTTIVVLVIHAGKAYWAYVGDSRLYLFEKNKYIYRTSDHSVIQMLVLSGMVDESEIRFHSDRNKLLRALGSNIESSKIIKVESVDISDNHVFLLCTDGYWELIDEETMEKLLKKSKSPDEWIKRMNGRIRVNGEGREMDNYSVICVFI